MSNAPTVILVTGGSGFLGRHLIPKLLNRYPDAKVKTVSRSENAIQKLVVSCPDKRLMPIVGDIRNISTVQYALQDVDTVIHLAAMKHIEICESHPAEAVSVIVEGTWNLLEEFGGSTFIGMSTDKAVEAVSCYGASKMIAERLILEQSRRCKVARYMVVRSGNIFGSTGSVLDKWRQQINQYNKIGITDPDMTRYFVSVGTLTDFIIKVIDNGKNGEIYIPQHELLALADMAKAVIDAWGNQDTELDIIGKRPGEKSHENLFTAAEKVVSMGSADSKYSIEAIKEWLNEIKSGI